MSRRARRVRQGGPNAGTHRSVGLPLRRRRQWHNNTGNQAVDAVCVVPARSVEELVAAVGRARDEGLTIRCVGSGHSWSDVALTTGYLVSPQHLGGVERVKKELLRSGVDGEYLVSVGSGTRIHEVNAWLDRHGLALQQMGGYDGQTLAGVVSTSTHGSGVKFGPFPDYVRSIDLVTRPATTNGLHESKGNVMNKITMKALLESQRQRFSKNRLTHMDKLLEDDSMPMDTEVAPAADAVRPAACQPELRR